MDSKIVQPKSKSCIAPIIFMVIFLAASIVFAILYFKQKSKKPSCPRICKPPFPSTSSCSPGFPFAILVEAPSITPSFLGYVGGGTMTLNSQYDSKPGAAMWFQMIQHGPGSSYTAQILPENIFGNFKAGLFTSGWFQITGNSPVFGSPGSLTFSSAMPFSSGKFTQATLTMGKDSKGNPNKPTGGPFTGTLDLAIDSSSKLRLVIVKDDKLYMSGSDPITSSSMTLLNAQFSAYGIPCPDPKLDYQPVRPC